MYELRGIEDCTRLRVRARAIEAQHFRIGTDAGPFDLKRGKLWLADEIGAAWIVYGAVVASWAYLAGKGYVARESQNARAVWHSWQGALLVVYVVLLAIVLLPPVERRWSHSSARAPAKGKPAADSQRSSGSSG